MYRLKKEECGMLRIVNKKKFIRGISIITVGLILVIVILVMIVKGIIYLFTRPVEAKNEEFNEVEEVSMSNK